MCNLLLTISRKVTPIRGNRVKQKACEKVWPSVSDDIRPARHASQGIAGGGLLKKLCLFLSRFTIGLKGVGVSVRVVTRRCGHCKLNLCVKFVILYV